MTKQQQAPRVTVENFFGADLRPVINVKADSLDNMPLDTAAGLLDRLKVAISYAKKQAGELPDGIGTDEFDVYISVEIDFVSIDRISEQPVISIVDTGRYLDQMQIPDAERLYARLSEAVAHAKSLLPPALGE